MTPGATPTVDLEVLGAPEVGAAAQLALARQGRPVAGQPVVEIRPGGAVDGAQRTAGTSDPAGQVAWTPDQAGFTTLEVGESSHTAWVAPSPSERLAGGLTLGLTLMMLVGGQLWLRRRERA